MRASASTQVSIDYRDEADAIRKMRVAQALVPIIAAFTDNVVRFESETPKPLSRLAMWRVWTMRVVGKFLGYSRQASDLNSMPLGCCVPVQFL